MSKLTRHGENIANQIQDEDAYGDNDDLTLVDLSFIIDNLHSHFLTRQGSSDHNKGYPILGMLGRWLQEVSDLESKEANLDE